MGIWAWGAGNGGGRAGVGVMFPREACVPVALPREAEFWEFELGIDIEPCLPDPSLGISLEISLEVSLADSFELLFFEDFCLELSISCSGVVLSGTVLSIMDYQNSLAKYAQQIV